MHKVFPPTDKRDIFIYIMLPGKDPEISEEPGTCESGMDGEGIQKTSFSLFFEQNVSKIGWGGGYRPLPEQPVSGSEPVSLGGMTKQSELTATLGFPYPDCKCQCGCKAYGFKAI